MAVPTDPYHKETLACLPDGDEHAKDERHVVSWKVTWAVEMARTLTELCPGGKPRDDIVIRSISISRRQKDDRLFLAVKANRKVSRKDDEAVVCFGSGNDLAEMLYETWQRIVLNTAKWREDVPWSAEDPHDRPEPLPKWD